MDTKEYRVNGVSVLELIDDGVLIECVQDLLDIVSDYSIKKIVIHEHNIHEDFYDLSTGFAGEVLKKITGYKIQLGIVGSFENVTDKSYRDFMFESTLEKRIVFKGTLKEAVKAFIK